MSSCASLPPFASCKIQHNPDLSWQVPAQGVSERMNRYLTTKELADLLRLKERKVYDMAAAGEVPCTRATGKLLFPRDAVDAWLQQHTEAGGLGHVATRPGVVLGSHDPLLEWALRESRCGLATFFDSSRDGLQRFAAGEGVATGLHVHCAETDDWNVPLVSTTFAGKGVVLLEWAVRQRGLIVAEGNPLGIDGLASLKGRRVVPRQATAGSQALFQELLEKAGLELGSDIEATVPALSETDAVLVVQDGKADATFGLTALAGQYRLDAVPVAEERFDLLIDRRSYFEPPLQKLLAFTRTAAFQAKASELEGYDVSGLGSVRFNGG